MTDQPYVPEGLRAVPVLSTDHYLVHLLTPAPRPPAFRWPCDRRAAHGPHSVRVQMLTGPADYEDDTCPGVPAHPATMAGGSHHDTRPERITP